MRTSVIATAFLAACAQAIKITSPPKGETLDLSEGFKITWDTVSSDPSSARIFIVNMSGGNTPFSKDLGEVDLSKGSFTVTEDDIPALDSYQFNIQSIAKENTGILAQSEQFEVKAAEKKSSKSSSASEYATTSSTSSDSESTMTAGSSSADATASDSDSSSTTASAASTFATASASGTATATKKSDANASSTAVADSAAPSVVASGSFLALAIAGLVAVMA